MQILKPVDRRKFLKQSAAVTAAVGLPFGLASCGSTQAAPGAIVSGSMMTREIPGTNEYLPVMGMGAPNIFVDLPAEGSELPKSIIQTMMDMGGRLIDTPAFFRPNDPVIGELITEMGVRDDLFLASKITINGKQEGVAHLERVMNNLQKRPIDLLLVHNMRDMANHWPTLKQWKAEGKVRYIGVSLTRQTDYGPLEKFMRDEKPDFVMTGYSITQQGPAERVLPLAADSGIAVIGVEPFKAVDDGAFFSMVAGKPLPEWAANFDCESWAQFSLKYILSNPAITSIVTETSKVHHVVDNMSAGYGRLPDQATRKLMADYLLAFA